MVPVVSGYVPTVFFHVDLTNSTVLGELPGFASVHRTEPIPMPEGERSLFFLVFYINLKSPEPDLCLNVGAVTAASFIDMISLGDKPAIMRAVKDIQYDLIFPTNKRLAGWCR